MSSILGNLNLNNVPIIYMNGEAAWVSKEIDLSFTSTDLYDLLSSRLKSNFRDQLTLYKSDKYISVVPKSILDNVIHSWSSLIQSIFYLNVLGAGLIAVSAVGLCYTKPEYKKTRLGLQALFIAGLASVVFAAFQANSSINLLQKF